MASIGSPLIGVLVAGQRHPRPNGRQVPAQSCRSLGKASAVANRSERPQRHGLPVGPAAGGHVFVSLPQSADPTVVPSPGLVIGPSLDAESTTGSPSSMIQLARQAILAFPEGGLGLVVYLTGSKSLVVTAMSSYGAS